MKRLLVSDYDEVDLIFVRLMQLGRLHLGTRRLKHILGISTSFLINPRDLLIILSKNVNMSHTAS
jgi:hypothetical protein